MAEAVSHSGKNTKFAVRYLYILTFALNVILTFNVYVVLDTLFCISNVSFIIYKIKCLPHKDSINT